MRKPNIESSLKRVYVGALRGVGKFLDIIGVGKYLLKKSNNRWAHWIYSLTAIHDIDRMIALDVPWWTYPAIDQVDAFLKERNNVNVFEYGSGASSIWLSKRALKVTSVEHDSDWFDILKSKIVAFENIELISCEPEIASKSNAVLSLKSGYQNLDFQNYQKAIGRSGKKYDLIVIDGRVRSACLEISITYLNEDGMIVFDNSARNRYQNAIKETGGLIVRKRGFVPSLPYRDETAIILFPRSQP